MTIAEKIVAAEQKLNASKDSLVEATKSLESGDDSAMHQVEELSAQVETEAKSLETLRKAEAAVAANIVQAKHMGNKANADLLFKSVIAVAEAHVKRVSVDSVLANRFGSDEGVAAITKAASAPARTDVQGWASELVRDTYAAFMDTLKPESVIPRLGLNQYTFEGYQSIKIPMRAETPNLAGAFRAEAAPIPVKQMGFTSKILTPKSMGVISTFSNELFERSTPNILDVIRSAMVTDTAQALDVAFLSNTAGSAIAPAGIQNGVVAPNTAASAGDTVADIMTDLRGRLQQMASLNLGRKPVWIMNPARAWGLQLATNAVGAVAFPEMSSGSLIGVPVVTSTNVPADVVYLVDAAEVYFAGSAPRFVGTDVATLHMEDTLPLEIVGSVTANPVRSLYQTNTAAIRAMWELDWTVNRTGAVQTITAVAW
jgi:HK97 family phage major capsid protein